MSFTRWLKQFEDEDNAIGDLAREVAADCDWPADQDLLGLVAHLEGIGACDDAIRALVKAHARWVAEQPTWLS